MAPGGQPPVDHGNYGSHLVHSSPQCQKCGAKRGIVCWQLKDLMIFSFRNQESILLMLRCTSARAVLLSSWDFDGENAMQMGPEVGKNRRDIGNVFPRPSLQETCDVKPVYITKWQYDTQCLCFLALEVSRNSTKAPSFQIICVAISPSHHLI